MSRIFLVDQVQNPFILFVVVNSEVVVGVRACPPRGSYPVTTRLSVLVLRGSYPVTTRLSAGGGVLSGLSVKIFPPSALRSQTNVDEEEP